MKTMSATPEPFLDWYGVYAGRVEYGEGGRARIDGAPQTVRWSPELGGASPGEH